MFDILCIIKIQSFFYVISWPFFMDIKLKCHLLHFSNILRIFWAMNSYCIYSAHKSQNDGPLSNLTRELSRVTMAQIKMQPTWDSFSRCWPLLKSKIKVRAFLISHSKVIPALLRLRFGLRGTEHNNLIGHLTEIF